jgi:membrane dipeptidase
MHRIIVLMLVAALTGCATTEEPMPTDLQAKADELAQRLLIADTHIDVPYRLEVKMEDVSERTEGGDFDYPRAREGGLDLVFMSIYIPPRHQETGDADQVADGLIDMMEGLARDNPDKFAVVDGVDEARERVDGRIALALGMENGAPVTGIEKLRHFHDRGVRYITLTHSKANHICDSSYDENRRWAGLSDFGRELVVEMNRIGMMIDVSHITDAAFDQVMALSRAPVLATHSSCRHFTPGWERNISDEMIRKLAAAGGVVHINFGSSFINDDYRQQASEARDAIEHYLEENGLEASSDEARAYRKQYVAELELTHADISEVADHIDHVVKLVGVDHVGIGSDYDGVGDSLPVGLEDVSTYPNLIRVLLERGYSEEEIEKICSGNLFRVWSEVERIATEMQAEG